LYPVACSPQAWAAASPYSLFESCLGITIRAADRIVEFVNPRLPESISYLDLTNMKVGKHSVDVRLRREGDSIAVDLVRGEGDVKVQLLTGAAAFSHA
jgi:hypothetical protein